MKSTVILYIGLVMTSFFLDAQNLILKKGKLISEDTEICNYKIDLSEGWLRLYDLKTNDTLIIIEESFNNTDANYDDDYVIFKFPKQEIKVEISGTSFWIDYVKLLYRNKTFDLNGQLNDLQIKLFKLRMDENITEMNSLSYSEKLNKMKTFYPFKNWIEYAVDFDMKQYTQENCDAAKHIFDNLIDKLIKAGEDVSKEKKAQYFETAVIALNALNNKVEGLIETGEREDLCFLIDKITIASGLNPKDYADGEGIADLWREW
ncbi:hypothetical protein HNV08_10100 [Winogradskyella eckloniae]|uniref:hypothetical protein n=1 Tax=Winogradskyella eckloniae TaxID=1089306 RepID=UPI0015653DFB|nr:hypothetical protein [Winogradskyella eckloniae]NRD20397.1 hypothetical protein [Winogradskyella eckloniae]